MAIPTKLPNAPPPQSPQRPTNVLHTIAGGINAVVSLPSRGIDLLNTGFATATQSIASVFPAFPAATLGGMAIGAPHAHPLHPPFIPLPPTGPIMFGCAVQVLINGMPAARCGDLGLNPTCCGVPPIYEIFTGSSNVFIGGARAARMTDITMHCKFIPPAGTAMRGAVTAMKTAMQVANVALMAGGMAAQGLMAVGDAIEAVEAEDTAMKAALGMSAGMTAAQMASDAVALAMGMLMGKDLAAPPGTPGMIMNGSPNVLIGGFPMPAWMAVAQGLLKLVKGLRARAKNKKSKVGPPSCPVR